MGRNVGSVEVEFRADKRQLKNDLNSLERDLGMATGRMKKDTQNLNYHMAKQFRDMGKQFKGLGKNFANMSDFTSQAVRLSVDELANLPDGLRAMGLEIDKEAVYMKRLGETTTTTMKDIQKSVDKTRVGFEKMTSMTKVGKDVTETLNDIRDASKKAQLAALGLNKEGVQISAEQSVKEMEKFQKSVEDTQKRLYELRSKGNFLAFNEGMRQLDEEISNVNRALKSTANNGKGAYDIMRGLGIVTSDMADASALAMERFKDRTILANEMLLKQTTRSEKQMKAIDGIKMYAISGQLLKLGKSMEQRAKEGSALNLAIKRIGKDAPFKDIQEEMRRIQSNAAAIPTIWAGFGIATAFATAGLITLSNHIDGRLKPAAEEFKSTWVDALTPFVEAFTTGMVKVIEFGTWIGSLAKRFAEVHPQLSQMVWGFLYLTLVVGTLLAPLGVAAGFLGSFSAVFSVLYSAVAAFVVPLLTLIGVAMLVAAVIVIVVASINNMWKASENFRKAITDGWANIKKAVLDALSPLVEKWDQLKAKFMELIETVTGGGKSMGDFWKWLGDIMAIVINEIVGVLLPILSVAFGLVAAAIGFLIDVAMVLIDVFIAFFPLIKDVVLAVWKDIKTAFDNVKAIFEGLVVFVTSVFTGNWKQAWEALKSIALNALSLLWIGFKYWFGGVILKGVGKYLGSMKNTVKTKFTEIKDAAVKLVKDKATQIGNTLSKLPGQVGKIFTSMKNKVVDLWKSMWTNTYERMVSTRARLVAVIIALQTTFSDKISNIVNSARDKFNSLKDKIVRPIESAKDKVLDIVERIKSAFNNMKISIPKFSLPKVSIGKKSMEIMGKEFSVPTFSVSWNAKGNIFNGASLLGGGQGVNAPALFVRNGKVINQVNSVKAKSCNLT